MPLPFSKMMRKSKYTTTPTKANPQDDHEEVHNFYPSRNDHDNSGSQDTPQSAGSNETNPNQAAPVTPNKTPELPSFAWNSRANDRTSPSFGELLEEGRQMFQQKWLAFLDEACSSSPCSNGETVIVEEQATPPRTNEAKKDVVDGPVLGISRMVPPGKENTNNFLDKSRVLPVVNENKSSASQQTVQTSQDAVAEEPPREPVKLTDTVKEKPKLLPDPKDLPKSPSDGLRRKAPLDLLEVTSSEAVELERSISELTMRSSYGGVEQLQKLPDNRRMAYYAVGKHHRQSGRGGNRRCYFSGKLILGGAPFYAGTVQQGLRTLVVFCLPSAVGLPDKETKAALKNAQKQSQPPVPSSLSVLKQQSGSTQGGLSYFIRDQSKSSVSLSTRSFGKNASKSSSKRRASGLSSLHDGASIASKDISRLSSLDDLSLSIEGDLDPNWGLDRDLLVAVLPEADDNLLKQMSDLYPEQFATLPVQVRSAGRWNLYVKFCFFSGLPIAEGEMHYKVKDDIADVVYGEELDLSHDVMEAVNGEQSAEILQLPNLKVFRYLRKHYAQQCSKLDDRVFRRTAWERVAPEI